MCSLEEDAPYMPAPEPLAGGLPTVCRKCASTGSVVLRQRDVYCGACFSAAAEHKFRAALGKSRMIRNDSKVMVAVSGGLSSSVLLHLVHSGITETSHKRLRVIPICVYINDPTAEDSETRLINSESILTQCQKYEIPLHMQDFASILGEEFSISEANTVSATPKLLENKFTNLVNSISSVTGRKDFVVKMRRALLVKCAKQLRCDVILTGEASTSLACTMLSNLALGRGAQIENDVSFCDTRDEVKILKPMKDLTYEELKYFADLKEIQYVKYKAENEHSSIQSAIHKFVLDLQDNFPATISTVCKTGEKMSDSNNSDNKTEAVCILCQSALDTQVVKSSALQATDYSRIVSSTGPQHDATLVLNGANSVEASGSCQGCRCKKGTISRQDIDRCLCYGCRLIVREIADSDMPELILKDVRLKIAMDKIRNEINDFLI